MRPLDVARATGVSTSTLRHYERLGLLTGIHRTSAGHRRYDPAAVDRVVLVQRALLVGFTLGDVRRVLSVRDRGGAPCQKLRALVAARLEALTGQIAELRALHRELEAVLSDWDEKLAGTPPGARAHLLEGLRNRPGLAGHAPRLPVRRAPR